MSLPLNSEPSTYGRVVSPCSKPTSTSSPTTGSIIRPRALPALTRRDPRPRPLGVGAERRVLDPHAAHAVGVVVVGDDAEHELAAEARRAAAAVADPTDAEQRVRGRVGEVRLVGAAAAQDVRGRGDAVQCR